MRVCLCGRCLSGYTAWAILESGVSGGKFLTGLSPAFGKATLQVLPYQRKGRDELETVSLGHQLIHLIIVLLLPMAFVFCIGEYLKSKRFIRMLFAVMTIGFLLVTIPIIVQEMRGNPALSAMGVENGAGNMEGKE